MTSNGAASSTAIDFRNTTIRHENSDILSSFNLSVAEGTSTCLQARSKLAANAVIRVLLGESEPAEGSVTVLGHPSTSDAVRPFRATNRLEGLGIRSAESTIRHHQALGRSGANPKELAQILTDFGIDDLKQRPVRFLSPAAKQLVALAMAAVSHADVLVLNDPLRGLAGNRRKAVLSWLSTVQRSEATVIAVVNRPVNLFPCDNVVKLEIVS